MFTDCPECTRQFHINAAQLSAASGQVKCGFCGRQFNALERLHDRPLTPDQQPPPGSGEIELSVPEPEPEFFIPDTESTTDSIIPAPVEPESVDGTSARAAGDITQELDIQGGSQPGTDTAAVADSMADELLVEPSARYSMVRRLLWVVVILLLIIISLAQLVWFKRDEILSRYPGLMPWARQICELVECEMIRHRDVNAIKIINRDVRPHLRFDNALLVNATMSNQSHTIQPFPGVQLVLFDTNGAQIAYRNFNPEDYLDASISILDGMAPDTPVHFVLEVTGPTEDAVSFEFNFF